MVEFGRRLGLGVEALHVVFAGQLSGQDHFQGYDAVKLHLSGLVDNAHAATGDLLQKLVIAEVADFGARRRAGGCRLAGRQRFGSGRGFGIRPRRLGLIDRFLRSGIFQGRPRQKAAGGLVGAQQGFHPLPQCGIAGTSFVQKRRTLVGRFLAGQMEQDFFVHGGLWRD